MKTRVLSFAASTFSMAVLKTVESRAMRYKIQPFTVRIIYVLPSDAEPWGEVKHRASEWLEDMQWFFADQMDRRGHGPKTFQIATDNWGKIIFHQIKSSLSIKDLQIKYWNNCKKAASFHTLRNKNDVVVYFYDSYSILGSRVVHAGARGRKRNRGGEAFLSSLHLKMARREWIADKSGYDGKVFEWISSEPMKADTLSWHGRGRQLGDISGSAFGIMAHELGHSFGLSHDRTNDHNRKGNLMRNGCRGMRGYFRPDLTDDFCVLSERNATVLNKSAFFAVRKLKPKSTAFLHKTEK